MQAYAIDADTGAPSTLGNPLIPAAFPSYIVADPLGRYVYFFERGIGIAAFVVEATGTLSRIPGLMLQTPNIGRLVMAPNGKFLFALDAVAKTVSVVKVDRATSLTYNFSFSEVHRPWHKWKRLPRNGGVRAACYRGKSWIVAAASKSSIELRQSSCEKRFRVGCFQSGARIGRVGATI